MQLVQYLLWLRPLHTAKYHYPAAYITAIAVPHRSHFGIPIRTSLSINLGCFMHLSLYMSSKDKGPSIFFKDVSLGIPKSDLLGVTVALVHTAVK